MRPLIRISVFLSIAMIILWSCVTEKDRQRPSSRESKIHTEAALVRKVKYAIRAVVAKR